MGGKGSKSKPEYVINPINPYIKSKETFTDYYDLNINNNFLNNNKYILLYILFIILYGINFIVVYYNKINIWNHR